MFCADFSGSSRCLLMHGMFARRRGDGFGAGGLWLCLCRDVEADEPVLFRSPCVSVWPLRRISFATETRANFFNDFWKLCREKWLLFIITIFSAFITFIAQQGGGSVAQAHTLNYLNRICNATISYCAMYGLHSGPHPLTAFYYYDAKNIMVLASILSFSQ